MVQMSKTRSARITLLFIVCICLSTSACLAKSQQHRKKQRVSLDLNGTYLDGSPEHGNKLRVKRWDKNHIWFFLNAYHWHTDAEGNTYPNYGECGEIIELKGNTATYEIDSENSLTFKFSPGKCDIEQKGDCQFGHNVYANGEYKRISRTVSK